MTCRSVTALYIIFSDVVHHLLQSQQQRRQFTDKQYNALFIYTATYAYACVSAFVCAFVCACVPSCKHCRLINILGDSQGLFPCSYWLPSWDIKAWVFFYPPPPLAYFEPYGRLVFSWHVFSYLHTLIWAKVYPRYLLDFAWNRLWKEMALGLLVESWGFT